MNKPDFIFKCRKCLSLTYTSDVNKMIDSECETCGEEFEDNWILVGKGDYDKEYGKK